jgi:hypothetical protein
VTRIHVLKAAGKNDFDDRPDVQDGHRQGG